MDSSAETKILEVLKNIDDATKRAGRAATDVTLVAVSKLKSLSEMRIVADLLLRHGRPVIFGENYVQELELKAAEAPRDWCFHLIGPLQSNKLKIAVRHAQTIETVGSLRHAEIIAKEVTKFETDRPIDVFLQVNISGDASKHGIAPELAEELALKIGALSPNVKLRGLMAITALYESAEDARPDFRKLAELGAQLESKTELRQLFEAGKCCLSMGMSSDYVVAIEEGATHIRVGSAIFGERSTRT